MNLETLKEPANVAVIGASGGIGAAFGNALSQSTGIASVYRFSRSALDVSDQPQRAIDLTDEASIAAAAEVATQEAPLDLVIVATGLLHNGAVQPEKSMSQIDADAMLKVFAINSVGPALVAKHFLPKMRRKGKSVFAALSARVGSISDNRLGGWTSYRASKSALNMVLRTLAVEHARRFPDSIVVGLHPGTVDTGLSQPFQRRVPAGQLFTPDQSARHLLAVIDRLTPGDTGGFFAWDGQPIEF